MASLAALLLSVTGIAIAAQGVAPSRGGDAQRAKLHRHVEAKLAALDNLATVDSAPPLAMRHPPAAEAARTEAKPSPTLEVNCDRGESVTAALESAKGSSVVVQIRGTCAETVLVDRADVTLSGTAAGGAIIDPPDTGGVASGPGIRATGAHRLVVRDLTLRGGTDGIYLLASWGVVLERVSITGNHGTTLGGFESCGVFADASGADIRVADLAANDCPLVAYRHSTVAIADSMMRDSTLDGPFSLDHSRLLILRSQMTNNPIGPQAGRHSETRVVDSTVDNSNESFAIEESTLQYVRSTITGSFGDYADQGSHLLLSVSTITTSWLAATRSSTLTLTGTVFNQNEAGAFMEAQNGSQVVVGRARLADQTFRESQINAPVNLYTFSDGEFRNLTVITGPVSCTGMSRALFNTPPAGGSSGCVN